MEDSAKKLKAIDLNTESLKLYVTMTVACIAGLIAYHNSPNIVHNEVLFALTLAAFIISGISSLVTLNSYITAVHNGKIDVENKLGVILNFIAIGFFALGLLLGFLYLIKSEAKISISPVTQSIDGIVIKGNEIIIGQDVKTKVEISRDSKGNILKISISD